MADRGPDRLPEQMVPDRPEVAPPEDPIKRIADEYRGTPLGEAAEKLIEADRELLALADRVEEMQDQR